MKSSLTLTEGVLGHQSVFLIELECGDCKYSGPVSIKRNTDGMWSFVSSSNFKLVKSSPSNLSSDQIRIERASILCVHCNAVVLDCADTRYPESTSSSNENSKSHSPESSPMGYKNKRCSTKVSKIYQCEKEFEHEGLHVNSGYYWK